MSELIQRTLSGAVFVAVVVCAVVFGFPPFYALVALFAMLAVAELHRLLGDDRSMVYRGELLTVLLVCVVYSRTTHVPADMRFDLTTFTVAYGALLLVSLIWELFRKAENPIRNWSHLVMGQVMVALPFALMTSVYSRSKWLMLALFVLIWTNDTFAYCTGSLLSKRPGGNHKMFPRVSPGKSWEGLVGGVLFALLGGYIFSLFVPDFTWWQWLLIALFISAFGTLGDLMESLLKRTIGVKDSGRFLPGHGGVLDRFDSLLLATPALWLLLLLL